MPTLDIRDLTVNYAVKGGTLQALAPVNLKMRDGDFVVALGASGCGKTTLLNCIAGFLPPSTGEILLDGQPVVGPGADRGVVFQKHALMPWLNVRDNVALGLRMRGVDRATRARSPKSKLALVGLRGLRRARRLRAVRRHAAARRHCARAGERPGRAADGRADGRARRLHPRAGAGDPARRLVDSNKMVFFITHSVEEALFLATRLIVMSPSPGRISHVYDDVPFSREFLGTPRRAQGQVRSPSSSACARRCWRWSTTGSLPMPDRRHLVGTAESPRRLQRGDGAAP